MGRRVGLEDVAVGGDELDREQVVGGEPVLGHQPAKPAAERVARDAGGRDRPPVTASPCSAAASFSSPQIDAALGRGGAASGSTRSPSSRRDRSSRRRPSRRGRRRCARRRGRRPRVPGPVREGERGGDVARRPAADDQSRAAVDQAVVHGAGRVVAALVRGRERIRRPARPDRRRTLSPRACSSRSSFKYVAISRSGSGMCLSCRSWRRRTRFAPWRPPCLFCRSPRRAVRWA